LAPVVRPVGGPPAAPPVATPVVPARDRGGDGDGGKRRARETAVRHGAPGGGGLSVGAKVGLASAFVTAVVLAVAVFAGRPASAEGGDPLDAVGPVAAQALAAEDHGLARRPDRASGEAKKAVEEMIAATEKEISGFRGEDEDALGALRQRRERLVRVLDAVAPGEAAGGTKRLRNLRGAGDLPVLGAVVLDASGKRVAETDPNLQIPASSAPPGFRDYLATVGGAEARVFEAPVVNEGNQSLGRALVAFSPSSGGPAGGGSKTTGIVLLVLGPLLVGGLAYALASGHAKPLRDLARELDRLGSTGDPKRRIGARGPEASAIARSVERMVANLRFRDRHEGEDLADVIAKEQGVAAEVHQGLIPKTSPRIPGYEVETLFKPGFEIGGDHFEYFDIDERHLGVLILDTSVRGIRAALVMSMARAYVRAEAPGVLSPARLLTTVNELLAKDLSPGQYVTALYVVIDTGSGSARVASAGHLPLIVYRHALGKTAIVNPEGIALGLDSGPVFERSIEEVEVEVGAGDRLVLHTDGALKVQNDLGEEFGEARLYDAVKREAPKNSQAFVNFVGGAIDAFHVGTPQNDDITISTVKRLK
jgi:serine phosphatase RsbU (regulator of sigma subunit)